MASAFTEKEKDSIRSALKEAAHKCAATFGMRKTTVDQLAESAGISKGAFYKFYESKELLFFEILEDWHTEIYNAAWEKWQSCPQLPDVQRASETLLYVCRMWDQNGILNFYENDLPYLLRKIPQDILDQHYDSDEVHTGAMIERMGIRLRYPREVACGTIYGLMLTLSHRKEIGKAYPQVLKILVQGACEQLILS